MAKKTFGQQASEFGALAKDLTDMKALDAELSRRAEAVVNSVASATLGPDRAHTGNGKGWNVPLDVTTRRLRRKDGIMVHPTRVSAGPWTEVDRGRNQGDVGMFAGPGVVRSGRNAGTTLRRKDGQVRKVRAFKARRWNGTTGARGTATVVGSALERELAPIVSKAVVALTSKRLGG